MKKAMSIFLSALMVLGLASCGSGETQTTAAVSDAGGGDATETQMESQAEAPEDAIICRLALTVSSDHAYALAYQKMADLIEEKTGGAIQCEMYYDGQMGTDREVIEAMQMGMMSGTMCSTNTFSIFVPALEVFDLPALFPTREIAYAIQDGELGQEVLDMLEGTGVTGYGFMEGGYYYLTNNDHEITTVEEMSGLKVRSQEATAQMMTWECLGMLPTIMSFSELFTALQQGVIDSQCNIAPNIITSKVYEVQKYVTDFPAMYMTLIVAFSDQFMDSLTEEQRQAVEESVEEAILWHRENNQIKVEENLQTMRDNGNVISELADGELERIRELCEPVYQYALETHGDIVTRLDEAVQALQ